MADYFSIDNVNLAFSLEKFDPRIHQPQPPGYPLFVLSARMVNALFHDAERTFAAIAILVSALSLFAAFLLGRRMFSSWAAAAGTFLLLVNPVFWHSGLDGPLRPNLALFSLLTAYCCWRCWNGEKQFTLWGAVALGVGGGFRPDLMAFLFPLWLFSSWVGTRSWRGVLIAGAVLAAIVASWTGILVTAMGGIETFRTIMFDYAADWSRSQALMPGFSIMTWLRKINRLVIWNWLAVISWIWALPFCLGNRDRQPFGSSRVLFFILWLLPGLIVQALTHFGAPGHALFSVSALCVLGGYVLSLVRVRETALAAALVVNVMLFLNFFPSTVGAESRRDNGRPSLMNAFLYGTFESSIGMVRDMDEITRTALKEIAEFTPSDRPSMILTTDSYVDQWFMNWRIGRYYLPDRDFWVLDSRMEHKSLQRIRRNTVVEARDALALSIPVFAQGRLLWLLEPDGPMYRNLASVANLNGGRYVSYIDITPDFAPFDADGFKIVPQKASADDHAIQ